MGINLKSGTFHSSVRVHLFLTSSQHFPETLKEKVVYVTCMGMSNARVTPENVNYNL